MILHVDDSPTERELMRLQFLHCLALPAQLRSIQTLETAREALLIVEHQSELVDAIVCDYWLQPYDQPFREVLGATAKTKNIPYCTYTASSDELVSGNGEVFRKSFEANLTVEFLEWITRHVLNQADTVRPEEHRT